MNTYALYNNQNDEKLAEIQAADSNEAFYKALDIVTERKVSYWRYENSKGVVLGGTFDRLTLKGL